MWPTNDDTIILCGLFVGVLALILVSMLAARLVAPAPAAPVEQVSACAVLLTPDQLSEISMALTERMQWLQGQCHTTGDPYYRMALEHVYAAFDEIALARGRAG